MKHLKEWGKSAEVYQEILQKFGDRVVPAQIDAANNIYQYTSVNRAVQERLAKWPKEGIEAYRTRYDAEAKAMLDATKSDDVAKLHRIYALYFITDPAKTSGDAADRAAPGSRRIRRGGVDWRSPARTAPCDHSRGKTAHCCISPRSHITSPAMMPRPRRCPMR